MAISDLLKFGGKRPTSRRRRLGDAPVPKGPEPVIPSKALLQVHQRALAHARAGPDRLRAGDRHQRRVLRRAPRLQAVHRGSRGRDRQAHAQRAPATRCLRRSRSASRRRTQSVDGVLCWDIFDFLEPAAAKALAREIVRVLRPGRRGDGLLLHQGRRARCRSPSTKSSRSLPRCGTATTPAPAAPSSCCRTATSSRCSTGSPSPSPSCSRATRAKSCCGSERDVRPVIALLTDFGTADHYAGTMKGVMLGICPDATLVDITHDIPAHDVLAGALELAAAYKYFPAGHDLRRGGGSGRRVGAPRCRGRYRRLSLRRARQRRPDAGAARSAGEEDRGADRAALRAPDGQPHVRGPRPLRAGGRLAGQGHPAARARARRWPRSRSSRSRLRSPPTTRCAGSCCASIGSAISSPTSIASWWSASGRAAASPSTPPASGSTRWSPPTRSCPPTGSARCSAAPTTWNSPPPPRAPPSRLGLARGAACHGPAV